MPTELRNRFLGVVEAAAIAAGRTSGNGNKEFSDHVAVEAMRETLQTVPIQGRIVIGEGERDEAPMLFIGEEVGHWQHTHQRVDIAVDPLEGTNLCAGGAPGAIAVLAASEEGGLLHGPDCYMNKLVVGPRSRGRVDLDAPVSENLRNIADSLDREVEDLLIVVLKRSRHDELIRDIREAGARIRLITDGDVAPAIGACITGTAVHALMGIGAAPEGVITAAAVRCLGGEMQGRLVEYKKGDRERAHEMGMADFDQRHTELTLAPGKKIIFAATGVTDGELLRGVSYFGTGCRTNSLVMGLDRPHRVRFVDTIPVDDPDNLEIRL